MLPTQNKSLARCLFSTFFTRFSNHFLPPFLASPKCTPLFCSSIPPSLAFFLFSSQPYLLNRSGFFLPESLTHSFCRLPLVVLSYSLARRLTFFYLGWLKCLFPVFLNYLCISFFSPLILSLCPPASHLPSRTLIYPLSLTYSHITHYHSLIHLLTFFLLTLFCSNLTCVFFLIRSRLLSLSLFHLLFLLLVPACLSLPHILAQLLACFVPPSLTRFRTPSFFLFSLFRPYTRIWLLD